MGAVSMEQATTLICYPFMVLHFSQTSNPHGCMLFMVGWFDQSQVRALVGTGLVCLFYMVGVCSINNVLGLSKAWLCKLCIGW